MSIIYQALQKTQQNRESRREQHQAEATNASSRSRTGLHSMRDMRWLATSLLVVIGVITAVTLVGVSYYRANPPPAMAAAVPVVQKPEVIQTANTPSLTLTGVLMTNNQKIALINDLPYREGDTINGMLISEIDFDQISLQDGNRTFVLHVVTV